MRQWFARLSERTARRLALCLLLAAALLLGAALWLNLRTGGGGYTLTTYAMGSYVQQTVYGSGREDAAQAASSAVTELENLISWRVEDSDTARLNQAAGTEFLEIDPQTWDILNTSLQVCQASGGAFDITIAPISWLWNFDEDPHLPQDSTIQSLLPAVNSENVSLLDDGTAALQTQDTALDLGSVGLYGEKPWGQLWQVSVRNPDTEGSLGVLSLSGGFLSTSGSYEKQFTEDGVTYHHILDPDTGYPAESGLLSVTVWSSSGALSDSLSTACFVLGMEDSLPVLEQFDSGAVFITQDHQIYVTENLASAFSLTAEGYSLAGTL